VLIHKNAPTEISKPLTSLSGKGFDITALYFVQLFLLLYHLHYTHAVCGRICLGRRKINLSSVFAGQTIGIREVDDQIWLVSFLEYDLGYFESGQGRSAQLTGPPPTPPGMRVRTGRFEKLRFMRVVVHRDDQSTQWA
jgi:hypothetical protein